MTAAQDLSSVPENVLPDVADARRRRDPEARPQQILDAAFHEFAERGLAGARLDDIAKRAGVAKGTIYLYFPNKEALFREMVRGTLIAAIETAEQTRDETAGDSAETQLRKISVNWWRFLRADRFQVVQRMVLGELQHFPDLMQFYADEVVARGRRLIGAVIARGTALGEFRVIEPDTAARMLSALTMMHSIWYSRRQCFPALANASDDDVRNELLDFYLHALRPEHTVVSAGLSSIEHDDV
jgi:AcrR family transcriptional regulator